MTVSSVTEMWSRAGGGISSDDGRKFNASFVRAFQVVHTADASRIEILNNADVPQLGDTFSEGGALIPGVFCKDVQVEPVGPIMTVATATYAGEFGPGLDDPLNAPPDITRSNKITQEPVDQDFFGNPITNSVGDPVDGITAPISDFQITVKRNFASINQYALRDYLRSHNSDTFDGWPPGTARFRTYNAREVRLKDRTYQEVTAVIEFREPYNTVPAHAWYARYRNEGLRERTGVQVAFTGGGGTGATGYAITNAAGGVTAVAVTNTGQGYTSAPTVAFTSENGTGITNGSGAAATANLTNDRVSSVTVGTAGTNYFSRLQRAVDDAGEPVTKPVLLAADGSRLLNTTNAVWIERPLSGALPYSVLGLLD